MITLVLLFTVGALTVNVIVVVPPLGATADAKVQLSKAPAVFSGAQLAGPVATIPAGNWSRTTTPAALATWPLLVTVSV